MEHGEDIDQLIEQYAARILRRVEELVPANPTEADFRRPIDELLDEFCVEAKLQPITHTELSVATGRADTVFNRLVIEYKRPGVLADSLTDRQTSEAVAQLQGYLESLAQKERQKLPRMGGVVLDGRKIIFVRIRDGQRIAEEPAAANPQTIKRLLEWTAALASDIALTPENLVLDFSIEHIRTQNTLRRFMKAMEGALDRRDSLSEGLFEQWRLFFSESIDYQEAFGAGKLKGLEKFARKAGLEVKSPEQAERFFYSLHTYFALLVKLLAWLALSRHLGVKLGAPAFSQLSSLDDDELRRQLEAMESGGIFRQYGLINLLEGDFFVWYLHAWNSEIAETLRELLKRLAEYDPTTLSIHPEETRDLFKKLYHYLLPREVRHNLGEYYTPDWLAQRLLVQVDNEFFTSSARNASRERLRRKLRELRWLDPTCGSGTFLILILRRCLELGRDLLMPEHELLECVTRNVVGFDLNPLAVMTARVNYLLAIADLLEHRRGDVTIPVYLADSVATPSYPETNLDLETGASYRLTTAVGTFNMPRRVFEQGFDRFCSLLDECVHSGLSAEAFLARADKELGSVLSEPMDRHTAESLYRRLSDLHSRGLNGLWARLIKNNFAPLTVGKFDYVIGNPPWINWEHLPDQYREQTRRLWTRYGLAHEGRLAIAKVDISALVTYTAADAYLKVGGRLAFVITQSVFKGNWGGRGFRRFSIPDGRGGYVPLRVVHVDDMVELQPFEGASNRTVVMILEKGKSTRYPVPYTLWKKKRGAPRGEGLTYDSTLEEVMKLTQRYSLAAKPVDPDSLTSAWLAAPRTALRALDKLRGASAYRAHAGVYTGGLNGVYFVEKVMERPDGLVVIRNITEGAKKEVPQVQDTVEPDLLYPLLRGRDVSRWCARPSAHIVMVASEPGSVLSEREMQMMYPRTYGYFNRFRQLLEGRTEALTRGAVAQGKPFYTFIRAGSDYTFAPWKVVWKEMAQELTCAVVNQDQGKPIIPDHKVMLVAFEDAHPAYYFAALMNSSPARLVCRGYAIDVQLDPHIAENIAVPAFDSRQQLHLSLAEKAQQAHILASQNKEKDLQEVESEIDRLAAELWGITDKELGEIQRALKIMT